MITSGTVQRLGASPNISARGRKLTTALMLIASLYLSLGFAYEYLRDYSRAENALDPFTDAITYLAAGERLNAGRELYALGPGDRPVLILDEFTAPLLSPPPIAVIWRPLAATEAGFPGWVIACWIALLGTMCYLIVRVGLPAFGLSLLLGQAIGEQLAVANVTAFFPALLVLSWRYRRDARVGAAIGVMAGLKLAPIAMAGWLAGSRKWTAMGWLALSVSVLIVVGVLGAGAWSYVDYLAAVSGVQPSWLSLPAITGIPWSNYAALVGGAAAAALLSGQPRLSYGVAVAASVFGSPAVYLSSLVPLLALAAPLMAEQQRAKRPPAPVFG